MPTRLVATRSCLCSACGGVGVLGVGGGHWWDSKGFGRSSSIRDKK